MSNPRALPGFSEPKPEPLYPSASVPYSEWHRDNTVDATDATIYAMEEAHRATIRELVVRTGERDEARRRVAELECLASAPSCWICGQPGPSKWCAGPVHRALPALKGGA